MKKKNLIIITITVILLIAGAMVGPIMSDVEQAKYRVISSKNNIEIREYDAMIIAEVEVKGERQEAIRQGFRTIADYIFGNNKSKTKIAMTAPVEQKSGEKIAMTAPVEQKNSANGWKVNFVMPSQYSLKTLPEPVNQEVKLKEIPNKKFIVICFSGRHTNANLEKHKIELLRYISENKIKTISTPKYAFYNPPWTLPFLKRNEVMVEIAD